MEIKKIIKIKSSKKRMIAGYLFTLPFIIGFLFFFLVPLIQSIVFSVSKLEITGKGFTLNFKGLENYYTALFVNAEFIRVFVDTILQTLLNIPAIIIFSFFAANLLNQKFKGRMLARTIFFLPVILSAGVIIEITQTDVVHNVVGNSISIGETMLAGQAIESLLLQLKLPLSLVEYIINAVNRIPEIIEGSAIPILIFLAGLQSIPSALYEVAQIEGATGWESFWKITFPLLSPLFITNIVYILVASFTNVRNPMVDFIQNQAWGGVGYGVSVAMTWIYFAFIICLLIITFLIIGKRVIYMD